MFEVMVDQPRSRRLPVSAEIGASLATTARALAHRSDLVWGEHCTECAWPTCYAHCSLYTPRADLQCRRFDEGIVPVVIEPDGHARQPAMRVGFRQWAKLEAHEEPRLAPVQRLQPVAALDRAARRALRSDLAPHGARKRAGQLYTSSARRRLRPPGVVPDAGDVFLVEAINEGTSPVPFTLTIMDEDEQHRFFQHGFTLAPGYNRHAVGVADIGRHVGLDARLFVRIEPTELVPGNSLVFTCADFVRLVDGSQLLAGDPPASTSASKVKCVVWDLDDTVWRGTLVEDGREGLEVRPEVRSIIEGLDERGILQSVASKNDPAEALEVLEQVGLLEYVLSPQVGWGTKSAAVRAIAEDLGIGIDSLLFIDDQPFERAEVAAAHPSIRVADAAEIGDLLSRDELDVPVTPESRRRRLMYRDESRRRAVLAEAPADFDAFLRACDVRLRLTQPRPDDVERIYELAQRTNQLNYSGDRLDRREVDEIVAGGGPSTGIVLHVTDRFGDYGTVGFVTIERQSFTITNFFMSCRVQRKKVENAFFATLLETARRLGADEVLVRHRATARNAPAVEVLQGLGAVPVDWAGGGEDPTGEVMYSLPSSAAIGDADIVTVADDALHRWT